MPARRQSTAAATSAAPRGCPPGRQASRHSAASSGPSASNSASPNLPVSASAERMRRSLSSCLALASSGPLHRRGSESSAAKSSTSRAVRHPSICEASSKVSRRERNRSNSDTRIVPSMSTPSASNRLTAGTARPCTPKKRSMSSSQNTHRRVPVPPQSSPGQPASQQARPECAQAADVAWPRTPRATYLPPIPR